MDGRDWDDLAWWAGDEELRSIVAAGPPVTTDGIKYRVLAFPRKAIARGGGNGDARCTRCHLEVPGRDLHTRTYVHLYDLAPTKVPTNTTTSTSQAPSLPVMSHLLCEFMYLPHLEGITRARPLERDELSPNRCTGRVGHVTWKLFFLPFVLVLFVHLFGPLRTRGRYKTIPIDMRKTQVRCIYRIR